MFNSDTSLSEFDPEISAAIEAENTRQEQHIELIASENHTSPLVMEAQGSVLTNKYAEGYPGKRYYGGCENVDVVEELAIARAKQLFNADYANVQPHSGSQANAAVYMALLDPGDTVLGMDLNQGGHLTHGSTVNFSGKLYHAVQYGLVAETGEIDYDQGQALAEENTLNMIVAGFSAYSRIVGWQKFRDIADSVGAYLMVGMAHVAGLVATGHYPNPIPVADVVTATTHKTLRGPRGGLILARKNDELTKKFNSLVFPGTQGGPLMHVIAAKAVALREAARPEFKEYGRRVVANAAVLAEVLQERGLRIVSGGTDNHLLMLDVSAVSLTGAAAEDALHAVDITANKNLIPYDEQPPMKASGVRLGTAAVTTRGLGTDEMRQLAGWMADVLEAPTNESVAARVRGQVAAVARAFPIYSGE